MRLRHKTREDIRAAFIRARLSFLTARMARRLLPGMWRYTTIQPREDGTWRVTMGWAAGGQAYSVSALYDPAAPPSQRPNPEMRWADEHLAEAILRAASHAS